MMMRTVNYVNIGRNRYGEEERYEIDGEKVYFTGMWQVHCDGTLHFELIITDLSFKIKKEAIPPNTWCGKLFGIGAHKIVREDYEIKHKYLDFYTRI